MKKVDLVYNVYHENSNRRKIEVVNILGYSIVKKKLDEAHIDYEVCEDEKEMEEKGIDLLPAMEAG